MKGIDVMKTLLGKTEKDNTAELYAFFKKYAIDNDISINPSKIPWCAAVMNACERAVGNKGTGKLNARSFLNYGTKVNSLKEAVPGDILVFQRGTSAWEGHVTYFVEKASPLLVRCLGGNQVDKVCIKPYAISHLLGIRRPPSS